MPSVPHPRPRPWIAMLLAAAAMAGTTATPAAAETLVDAIAAAYARYPLLRAQRLRQKIVDEQYVQTRSQYGPTLSLSANGLFNNQRFQGRSIDGNQGTATLSLRQPLYTGGRLRGELAAARADVQAGEQTLRQVEAETIQNVIIVYSAVLRDVQRVAVSRENVAVLQDQLRENRARRRVEDSTLTDVAQADARLAAAEYQLATLESTLAVSRGQFLQVVGHMPTQLDPLPDLPGLPATDDEALALAEANNPALLASKFTERASSATIAAVRAQALPTVSLSAQAEYLGPLSPFDTSDYRRSLGAGVTISQPLYASGLIRSRIRQAKTANAIDQVGIDNARRGAVQTVVDAWSQLSATRIALVSGTRQVASAQLAFAGMRREQRFGLRSTIEVLNAEQELQAAQLTLLQNRYSEYVARAQLLAVIGRLEARYVAPDIVRFDPEAEFRAVRNTGRTPLEPIAQAIDRIGSAGLRAPLYPDLTGIDGTVPDALPAQPPTPGPALTRGALVPIRQSPLVPASELPGGMPATGYLPPRDPAASSDPDPVR